MVSEHSRLAPSSAGSWVKCHGFIKMQADDAALPDGGSEAAREGEASHWVASSRLTSGKEIKEGDTAPNGVIITREMIDCAMVFATEVWNTKSITPHSTLHVESKVHASMVHPELYGTPDAWLFDSQGKLCVWDYKYGYGVVEVIKNWQMISYALGVLSELEVVDPRCKVALTIVQPRPYHEDGRIRSWTTDVEQLGVYAQELKTAAEDALSPNPKIVSGPQCKYCRARHACPAAHRAAMQAIDITHSASIESLDPEALSHELTLLRRAEQAIKYRLTGVEAQAMAAIKEKGIVVPGYRIGAGQGRKKWTSDVGEVFVMGELVGVDLRKAPDAITPTQAINAGVSAKLVEKYSAMNPGKVKLVPDDGSRAQEILGGK